MCGAFIPPGLSPDVFRNSMIHQLALSPTAASTLITLGTQEGSD